MRPAEIRAQLKAKEVTIVSIARSCQLPSSSLHRVISGRARHRRAEEALATVLGTSRESLFGLNERECRKDTPEVAQQSS